MPLKPIVKKKIAAKKTAGKKAPDKKPAVHVQEKWISNDTAAADPLPQVNDARMHPCEPLQKTYYEGLEQGRQESHNREQQNPLNKFLLLDSTIAEMNEELAQLARRTETVKVHKERALQERDAMSTQISGIVSNCIGK